MARSPLKDKSIRKSFIYEAVIVSHLDPTYMGTLEVELLNNGGNDALPIRTGQLITVKYLSPFYGVTSYKGLSENDNYRNSQQSYGFWAVPPDVGTRVLVVFAGANSSKGYWIGCIQDEGMNFMIPDGRPVTSSVAGDVPEELQGKRLPVSEYNKLKTSIPGVDTTPVPRPYNFDFTQILEVQGLLDDGTRGGSTSSARREVPSMVFGMSTPGPLDKRATATKAPYGSSNRGTTMFSSRLGGSSFVMDDGDPNLVRSTHAADGPPYYVNKKDDEAGGDETIPHNEGIRLRTRTGHQILLSNSEDLIYVGNSRGTAWIEMTSDGKIDIFANDSISVYSEQDFNFVADRDINFDAGRNINMWASARWSENQTTYSTEGIRSGDVVIMGRNSVLVRGGQNSSSLQVDDDNIMLHVKESIVFETDNDFSIRAAGNINLTSESSFNLNVDRNILSKAGADIVNESANTFFQTSNNFNLVTGANLRERIGANRESNVTGNNNVQVNASNYLSVSNDNNIIINGSSFNKTSGDSHNIVSGSNYSNITGDQNTSVAGSAFTAITGDQNSLVAGSTFSETLGDSNMTVSGSSFMTTTGDANIQGANINMDSTANINQNTGSSSPAMPGSPVTAASSAGAMPSIGNTIALTGGSPLRVYGSMAPMPLGGFTVPRIVPGIDETLSIITICTRVPQHEPWPHHENLDPVSFKPELLDREIVSSIAEPKDRIVVPETLLRGGSYNRSLVVDGSGGIFGLDGTPVTPGRPIPGSPGSPRSPRSPGSPGSPVSPVSPGSPEAPIPEPSSPGSPDNPGGTAPPSSPGGLPRGPDGIAGTVGRTRVPPTGNKFGSSQGTVSELQGGTRRGPLQETLVRILRQAAEYARVDVEVYSGGQPSATDVRNGRRWGSASGRTGSLRHNYGWAADLDLKDGNRYLNIDHGDDLAKMINFVRSFRDFSLASGEVPAGGVATGYMAAQNGSYSRMHLDLAYNHSSPGCSGSYNFYSERSGQTWTRDWMWAIMYNTDPNAGDFDSSGNCIGIPPGRRFV